METTRRVVHIDPRPAFAVLSRRRVVSRAVHEKTPWRRIDHHRSLDGALFGNDGAAALFAGRVRTDVERHGEPLYVLVWEEGAADGAVARKARDGVGIETAPVAMRDILEMESEGGASHERLAAYFDRGASGAPRVASG